MALAGSYSAKTRIADLDSQRHVSNRVYEQFCAEGRYRLLEQHGWSLETLLARGVTLRPAATYVKFHRQQRAGAALTVETTAYPAENGVVVWDHSIRQDDGELACQVQALTSVAGRDGSVVEILPVAGDRPDPYLIEGVPDFSGTCQRAENDFSPPYSDMDYFGDLPVAAWWRIFEEGRHMAGDQLGLTRARFLQFDTMLFWIAGTYRFYRTIRPGQKLVIYTWLERIVRIRAIIRQEIRSADDQTLVGASREEHLIVSLQHSRPKAMPAELGETLTDYMEFP